MYSLQRYIENCLTNILQILTYEWDPLHIKSKPNAEEEYEDYAGTLCSLLVLQKPPTAITEYLWEVETRILGLDGNFTHTEEIAKKLFALNKSGYKSSSPERMQGFNPFDEGSLNQTKSINLQRRLTGNIASMIN